MREINRGIIVTGGTIGSIAQGDGAKVIHNERASESLSRQQEEQKDIVDIAIITVLEDEFRAALQRFKTEYRNTPGGLSYYMSRAQTWDARETTIAITRSSEQGNDASQKLAGDIIRELNPRLILVVGIAGGVPHDDFTLGDVIVSTRVLNFNVDAQNADGTITVSARGGSHPVVSQISALLPGEDGRLAGWNERSSIGQERPGIDLQRVQAYINGDNAWRDKVWQSLHQHFSKTQQRQPLFRTGHIASSNHLMKNPVLLAQWLTMNRGILAVEMETAGVYEAAQTLNHQYPVMAIRGISDIVGLSRDGLWAAYACQTAAAFAHAFILTDPLKQIPRSQIDGNNGMY